MKQLEIIHSKPRTIAIEIKQHRRIVVRASLGMKNKGILRFVDEKQARIEGSCKLQELAWLKKTLFKLKKFALWRTLLRKISPSVWQNMLQSLE